MSKAFSNYREHKSKIRQLAKSIEESRLNLLDTKRVVRLQRMVIGIGPTYPVSKESQKAVADFLETFIGAMDDNHDKLVKEYEELVKI